MRSSLRQRSPWEQVRALEYYDFVVMLVLQQQRWRGFWTPVFLAKAKGRSTGRMLLLRHSPSWATICAHRGAHWLRLLLPLLLLRRLLYESNASPPMDSATVTAVETAYSLPLELLLRLLPMLPSWLGLPICWLPSLL